MPKSKEHFEDYLKKLEETVAKLEGEEVTLEESLKLYEEGLKMSKKCEKILDEAKQKIIVVEPEN